MNNKIIYKNVHVYSFLFNVIVLIMFSDIMIIHIVF